MSMQPAPRSSKPPLGGISGDWRRRILRFHVPIALASALVLAVFLTLSSFEARAYPAMDMRSGSFFPREMDMENMDHGGDQDAPMDMDQGGDQDGPTNMDHGGDRDGQTNMDHGGDEAEQTGGDS